MAIWSKVAERVEVISDKKLCEKAGPTRIGYVRYEDEEVGRFSVSDPTLFPDKDMATYSGGYSADIRVKTKEDGTFYPEIFVIDGRDSFVLVQDQDAINKARFPKIVTKEDLTEAELTKIETVESIFIDAIGEMSQTNPENPVFKEMKDFYAAQIKMADNPEQ